MHTFARAALPINALLARVALPVNAPLARAALSVNAKRRIGKQCYSSMFPRLAFNCLLSADLQPAELQAAPYLQVFNCL
jgi:hypothetical protein